jgi:hypothetical protein
VKLFGAKGDGVADDTDAIQSAVDAKAAVGGGTVLLSEIYRTRSPIVLRTGITLMGTSMANAGFEATSDGQALIAIAPGSTRVVIQNLWLDGKGRPGTTAIVVDGTESAPIATVQLRDVRIDGVDLGIHATWAWTMQFENIRMISVKGGVNLATNANAIALRSVHVVTRTTVDPAEQYGVISHNNGGVEIAGGAYEGFARIKSYQSGGMSVSGVYFENTSGVSLPHWIEIGSGSSEVNGGYSIRGNMFGVGAEYAVQLREVDGIEIDGNQTATSVGLVDWELGPRSFKRNVAIGSNQLVNAPDGPSRILPGLGQAQYDASPASITDLTRWQHQPLAFRKSFVPKDEHLFPETGAISWDGATLAFKWKDRDGRVATAPLAGARHLRLSDTRSNGALITSTGGVSEVQNGTWVATNENEDGTQGNVSVPSWAIDVGGHDAVAREGSGDAFSIWRRPAGGVYANVFRVSARGFPAFGGHRMEWASAAPVSGTWIRGDVVFNSEVSIGHPKGWVCTEPGSPGTWASMGDL